MTNTEIIQAIRAEIERLKSNMDDRDPLAPNQKAGYLFALADVLSFLDTLEDPVDWSEEQIRSLEIIVRYGDKEIARLKSLRPQKKED